MTLTDVSSEFCIPTGTLYYWRSVKSGPPTYKAGRRVLYKRAEVVSWIEAQRSPGAA